MKTSRLSARVLLMTGLLLAIGVVSAFGQSTPEKGTIGLSAMVQSNQMDILLPVFVTPSVVLVPSIGYQNVSDSFSKIAVGIGVRGYLNASQARPYLAARAGLLSTGVDGSDRQNDYLVGGAFGAEYFFNAQFSVGAEGQLTVIKSDKGSYAFGYPDRTIVQTGTAAMVSVYF